MAEDGGSHCCGPGYASPAEAMKAPREKILYTVALYIGTGIQKPDYLATIDADPESPTYSQVISRLEMPGIGDELHHTGWNACSSCHHDPTKQRRYLIVPGVRSSNLHIVDCGIDQKAPRLHKVIAGAEIKPGPTCRLRTRCTASARTSSSRCLATRAATRPAASCT
jgi:selenium-binding protein 1